MEASEVTAFESSTISEAPTSPGSSRLPRPTMRMLCMAAGAIMVIAVLGVAGYIFVKGPDTKGLKLADARTSKAGTARGGVESTVKVATASKKAKPAPVKHPKNKNKNAAKKKKKKASKKGAHRSSKPGEKQNAPSAHAQEDGDKQDQTAVRALRHPSDTVLAVGDDEDATQAMQKDERSAKLLFQTEPACSTDQDIHRCQESEQVDMLRSYICMHSSERNTCPDWRPQRQCLAEETNRFKSSAECETACKKTGTCGKARTCDCTGLFRKVNYVFDSMRKRCRLIPRIECTDQDVGFSDEKSCNTACENEASEGDKSKDTRCRLGSLESLVRPCLWEDKVYTYYFDHRSNSCEPWDETACVSNSYIRLAECLDKCVVQSSNSTKQRLHAARRNPKAAVQPQG